MQIKDILSRKIRNITTIALSLSISSFSNWL